MCLWNRILGVSGKRTGNSWSVQRKHWVFLRCLEKVLGILGRSREWALLGVSGKSGGHAGAEHSGLQQCIVLLWLLEWANGGLLHISILTHVIYLFIIQRSYSAIHVFITTDIFAGGFNYSNCFHHSLIGMKQDWSRLFKFLENVFVAVFFFMDAPLELHLTTCSIGHWLLIKSLYKMKSSTSQVPTVL